MYYKTDGKHLCGYAVQGNWKFDVLKQPHIPPGKHPVIEVSVEDPSGGKHTLRCKERLKIHRRYEVVTWSNGAWRTTVERGKDGRVTEYIPVLDVTRRYYSTRLAQGTVWTSDRAFNGYTSFNDRFKDILRTHGISVDHTRWDDGERVMLALAL
jgi:hypothetical protein